MPDALQLQTVMLPVGSVGRVFYATTTDPVYADPAMPPPVDLDAVIGNATLPDDIDALGNSFWEDLVVSPPADIAAVRWVAIYFSALPSGAVPAMSRIGLRPTQAACSNSVLMLSAQTRVYASTAPGGSEIAVAPSALVLSDAEPITLGNATPTVGLVVSGDTLAVAGALEPLQIGFTVSNQGPFAIGDGELVLTWPTLSINGVAARPEFVGASGGSVDASNAANGEVVLLLGPLAVGADAVTMLSLRYPAGVVSNATHVVNASVNVAAGACSASADASKFLVMVGAPQLQVSTSANQTTLAPGGDLSFTGHHRNAGNAVASGAIVYGRVPPHTTFQRAELAPGRSLACSGPPLDANLPMNPGDFSTADFANFEAGTQDAQGWTCPRGGETSWIAVGLDDNALTPPVYTVGADETWQLKLHNDEIRDEPDQQQQDSALGTLIDMQLAILASDLLPAIGPAVSSTVTESVLQASCDPPPRATNQHLDYAIPNSNGTAPVQFSIISGVAPGCITLDDQGLFSGSSAVIGEFNVVVRVRDALLQQVDVTCHLSIVAEDVFGDSFEAVPWTPTPVPDACTE